MQVSPACRTRNDHKQMSLQAVLRQLLKPSLGISACIGAGCVLSVSRDDTHRRQLKYQIFRYRNPFICY